MSIKKFFVFVLLSFFAMGASGAWAVYQGVIPGEDKIVQINETNFPDPKFNAYVRAHFDDGGHSGTQNPVGDGWLGGNELVSASKLNLNDVFSDDISAVTNESIQGLEQLTYLIELRFSNTAITSLSLNKLPHLETLYCWHNPSLKTLDVSAGTKLETLICNDCALEGTLDLRNNTALDDLECYNNPELEVMLPPAGTYRGVRAVYCYGIKAIGPSEFVNGVNTLGPSIFGSRLRTFAASDAGSYQAATKGVSGNTVTVIDFSNASGVETIKLDKFSNLEQVTLHEGYSSSLSSLSLFTVSETKVSSGIINTLLSTAKANEKLSTLRAAGMGWRGEVDLSEFTNLSTLDLSSNDLTAVTLPGDLTQLWGNVTLNLSNNALTSLAVPTGITHLIISNNNFTSLPAIPESVKLLEIGGNKFTAFPTIPATVTELDISNLGLTEVDLSKLESLDVLIASDNNFTTLDLTKNSRLNSVSVDGNKNMTSIKLDGLQYLKNLNISRTKIPLSSIPTTAGRMSYTNENGDEEFFAAGGLYADEMDESFFGSDGTVDLSQHTGFMTVYMRNNGESFKKLILAPSDTGYSHEYSLSNNGLTSVNLPADACWITLDNNHLATLELGHLSHLETISFEGQTFNISLLSHDDRFDLDMNEIVGSENLSKVSAVTGYNSGGTAITSTNSGGVYTFTTAPSKVTYRYDTGGKMRYTGEAVLMEVEITVSVSETQQENSNNNSNNNNTNGNEQSNNTGNEQSNTTGNEQSNNNTDDGNNGEGETGQTNVTTTVAELLSMDTTQREAIITLKLTGQITDLATTIQTVPNLNDLDLTEAEIETVALDATSAPELETITLTGNTFVQTIAITNGVIKNLFVTGCTNLRTLSCPGNSLMALDLEGLTSLQEATVGGQTRTYELLSEDMNFSTMVESSVFSSSSSYGFYAAFSPVKIENLKGFDASGKEISKTYNNVTGEVNFESVPAKIQYDYNTGFNNTLMDVTLSAGSVTPPTSSDPGTSGGGCNVGFGAMIMILFAAGMMLKVLPKHR